MLTVNNLTGFGGGSIRAPLSISFTDSSGTTSDLSTYNFTSKSIGAVAGTGQTRWVLVVFGFNSANTPTVDSMSINGVSCVILHKLDGATRGWAYGIAAVPTGTSVTISVGLSETCQRAAMAAYRIISGPHSELTGPEYDNDADTTYSGGLQNIDMNVPAGGVAIAHTVSTDGSTHTWTELLENCDFSFDSGDYFTTASRAYASGKALNITIQDADTTPGAARAGGITLRP